MRLPEGWCVDVLLRAPITKSRRTRRVMSGALPLTGGDGSGATGPIRSTDGFGRATTLSVDRVGAVLVRTLPRTGRRATQ